MPRNSSARHRNYTFTHNNYVDTSLEDTIECRYIAYSHEIAPTTGTPHLQGYISFHDAKTASAARRALPGCHVEVMMGSFQQNEAYCSKQGSQELIERGECPLSNENQGRAQMVRFQSSWDLAKQGRFEDIDADIRVRYYSTLKSIHKDYMVKPPPCNSLRCYWIYGETGTGKSHSVEHAFPTCYKKDPSTHWFDGYQGEEVVYLEDVDTTSVKHLGLFKRLADKWPLNVQSKGSGMYIRPSIVVVTSNWRIQDIWPNPMDHAPLLRRFTEIEKLTQEQDIDFTQ